MVEIEVFEKKENKGRCPECDSNDVWNDDMHHDENWVNEFWSCGTCGLEYMISFKFDHIEWFKEKE